MQNEDVFQSVLKWERSSELGQREKKHGEKFGLPTNCHFSGILTFSSIYIKTFPAKMKSSERPTTRGKTGKFRKKIPRKHWINKHTSIHHLEFLYCHQALLTTTNPCLLNYYNLLLQSRFSAQQWLLFKPTIRTHQSTFCRHYRFRRSHANPLRTTSAVRC